MRPSTTLLALVLALGALTGCTASDPGPEPPEGWTEPGWMAEVRQAEEEYVEATLACYREHGVEGTRIPGAGVGFLNKTDEHGQLPPGLEERQRHAGDECNERVAEPAHWAQADRVDEAAYGRLLDIVTCIEAHGHEAPEPPSFDSWRDARGRWNPFQEMFGGAGAQAVEPKERARLLDACPQHIPQGYYEVVPLDD